MSIPLYLAVEDDLSENVLRKVLSSMSIFQIIAVIGKKGYGELKKNLLAYNKAAIVYPFLLLTDLDKCECPPTLIREWLNGITLNTEFIFRVAVPEVESWLLADDTRLRSLLGLKKVFSIKKPEELSDAKMKLLDLAERSKICNIREAMVYRDKNGQRRVIKGRIIMAHWGVLFCIIGI
jgi:hypothetical protein